MNKITVKSLRGPYEILVGKSLLEKTGLILRQIGLNGKAMVVVQPSVAGLYLRKVLA